MFQVKNSSLTPLTFSSVKQPTFDEKSESHLLKMAEQNKEKPELGEDTVFLVMGADLNKSLH